MGLRGPSPKLAAIKRLEGNPGNYPIEDYGIEAQGFPFIPDHLAEDAQGCIDVITQSMPPKVYSALDSYLLAAFGTAWAVHKRAAHEIASPDFEYVVSTPQGTLSQSPWLQIERQHAQLLATLGDKLGLDPKARAALKLPSAKQQRSKFDGLIAPTSSSPSSNASRSRAA